MIINKSYSLFLLAVAPVLALAVPVYTPIDVSVTPIDVSMESIEVTVMPIEVTVESIDVTVYPIGKQFSVDIDGDGQVKPLTDGLLNLRYQFGFRGDALISGALDGGATRKSAGDIETYLSQGNLALDVDGDQAIKPLTDGLLTLRYLFGFRGDTLISGAVGSEATRKTSTDIEAYINSMIH